MARRSHRRRNAGNGAARRGHRDGDCRQPVRHGQAAAGVEATGSFGEVERWRFDWDQPYTGVQWLEQVPTFGGHQLLSPGALDELLAGLRRAIDAVGGAFTMRYASVCVVATRSARTRLGAER